MNTEKPFEGIRVGAVVCGSFCTFAKVFDELKKLRDSGADITPVMSYHAYSLDTRFGLAEDNVHMLEEICGKEVLNTLPLTEPVGPKKMFDVVLVAPCTGNTLAKLAGGITDTPAAMAVKSHLRNGRPVVIAVSTNDALSASAKNIGMLLNTKNYYFVPFSQDDHEKKPTSLVADFSKIQQSLKAALAGVQLQPILYTEKR